MTDLPNDASQEWTCRPYVGPSTREFRFTYFIEEPRTDERVGKLVAVVHGDGPWPLGPRDRAYLIRAAPELLAVLKLLITVATTDASNRAERPSDATEAAIALVAKVKAP